MRKRMLILAMVCTMSVSAVGCSINDTLYAVAPGYDTESEDESDEEEDDDWYDEDDNTGDEEKDWWLEEEDDEWDDEIEEDEEIDEDDKIEGDVSYSNIYAYHDWWNFYNFSDGDENGNGTITADFLSPQVREKLFMNLMEQDANVLRSWIDEEATWGHCQGMAVTAALIDRGICSKQEFGIKSELKQSSLNENLHELLEFYHVQQFLSPMVYAADYFMSKTSQEQLQEIESLVNSFQEGSFEPFMLSFQGYFQDENGNHTNLGAHAVEIIGYERGDWSDILEADFRGEDYPCRLIVYDSNAVIVDDRYNFYYNVDKAIWCIPAYGLYSRDNTYIADSNDNNATLKQLIAHGGFLNTVNYETGDTSELYKEMNGVSVPYMLVQAKQNFFVESQHGKAEIENGRIADSSYEKNALCVYVPDSVKQTGNSKIVVFPENESYYKIDTEKEKINVLMRVGTSFISVKSDSSGEFKLKEDGTIDVNCDQPAVTTVEYLGKISGMEGTPGYRVTETEGSSLHIQPSLTGVKVDTDDEAHVEIKTSNYGTEKELVTESVKGANYNITKKGTTIEVKADTTNDGKYETLVSVTQVPKKVSNIKIKDKKVTFNGKNRMIDEARTSSDLKGKKVYYYYYKDKKCTKLAKSHSNAGTYYVRAKVNLNGYIVESNVAKLTITKSKTTYKLNKTKYSVSAKKLKNKNQKIQLTTTAKDAIEFKKLTGNKNIVVSKKGAVTIRKGLERGKYVVQVKMSSSNYKTSKKQKISIQVK